MERGKRFKVSERTIRTQDDLQLLGGEAKDENLANVLQFLSHSLENTQDLLRYSRWLSTIFSLNMDIRDGDALSQISPEVAALYVEDHGWLPYGKSELAWWYRHPSHELEEGMAFTLPFTRTVDWSLRAKDLIIALAKQQGKTQLMIYFELVY